MNSSSNSNTRIVRRQKLGLILIPPIITGLCLLAGFDLVSTTLVTLATVFPASLYGRRLTALAANSPHYEQEEETAEILQDSKNMVVYKTAEGPQVIGFYKILQRPPGYVFHTLRAKFAQANLTIYPMIHANGPFLAIRYCDNGSQNQKEFTGEMSQQLDTFTQILMQKVLGLALEPASSADVKTLVRVFGLKISEITRESSQVIKKPDYRNLAQVNNERSINSIIKDSLSSFESLDRKFATREHGNTITKESTIISPESKLHFLNKNADPAVNGKEALAILADTYQQILATIESVQGSSNAVPITSTAKRIAGRLVVKDLTEVLDTCQTLARPSPEIQNLLNAFQAYLEHYFGDLTAKSESVKTEELWEHIPGAVVVLGMILEKLEVNRLANRPQWPELSQRV